MQLQATLIISFYPLPDFYQGGAPGQFMTSVLVFSLIIAFSAKLFTPQKYPIGQIYHLVNWIKQTGKLFVEYNKNFVPKWKISLMRNMFANDLLLKKLDYSCWFLQHVK